jgi:hypothetical protein
LTTNIHTSPATQKEAKAESLFADHY